MGDKIGDLDRRRLLSSIGKAGAIGAGISISSSGIALADEKKKKDNKIRELDTKEEKKAAVKARRSAAFKSLKEYARQELSWRWYRLCYSSMGTLSISG